MGSNERRAREKQELRARILDAARQILVEEGDAALTMRRIAERIEYSPTAIYLHFPDKTQLLAELIATDFGALAQDLAGLAEIRDPVARMAKLGSAYIAFGLSHPQHYQVMFSPQLQGGAHDAPLTPDANGYVLLRDTVAAAIEQGCLRPELDDPELVAQVAWAGVHGVVSLLLSRGDVRWTNWRDHQAIADLMIDVLMRGMVRAGRRKRSE